MIKSIKRFPMTILEVLVAMTVLVIIMSLLAKMIFSVSQISRRQQQQSDLYQAQRQLLSVLALDLNSIVTSTTVGEEINCNFTQLNVTIPNFTTSAVYARFISNSGLGVRGTDKSTLQEVVYVLSDSEVYRYYTRESAGPATWDFYTDSATANWWATVSDSALVASSVDEFFMEAYDSTGAAMTLDDSTTPAYIVATVILRDEADNSSREFKKKIFVNRGN